MNSFKIRFSDVLRYFILGGIELLLYIFVVDGTTFYALLGDGLTSPSAVRIAVICGGLYLLGFITQSMIQLFFGGDFLGTGVGEVAEYIRFYPVTWLNSRGYPDWVYWSDRPRRVLDIYKDILETDENAETKTEFLYSNQLFQGTAFAILAVTLYKYLTLFNSLDVVWRVVIMGLMVGVIWLIHWICGNSKRIIIPVSLGFLMIIVVLFLGCAGSRGSWLMGAVLAIAYLITSWLAASLARKQIRRVDILAKYNHDKEKAKRFQHVLARVGVPKFYILTRTNSPDYITEELESICSQTYPNIKVVILLDKSLNTEENYSKRELLFNKIDSYRDRLSIQTYESGHTGPAFLAYEIREIFINYANEDDMAMILDSDDKLYSPSVVAQIVTRMYRTLSNICLIRFEIFGKQNLNYSKNRHNELVKDLFYKNAPAKDSDKKERRFFLRPDDINREDLHRISTIGWTKCYRKGILNNYHEMVKQYLSDIKENELEGRKYEDFPDIVVLLQKEARICAVAKNSVLFRRTGNSVTTKVTADNYDNQIPFFLQMAIKLATKEGGHLVDYWADVVVKGLIPYKFVQYLNVVYKKTHPGDAYDKELAEKEHYSCDKYYRSCISRLLGIELPDNGVVNKVDFDKISGFHEDVKHILAGDDYSILGDFPKDIKQNSDWKTIRRVYDLTEIRLEE